MRVYEELFDDIRGTIAYHTERDIEHDPIEIIYEIAKIHEITLAHSEVETILLNLKRQGF